MCWGRSVLRLLPSSRLTRLESQVTGAEKKLSNPGFVAKAPAQVVEKQRQNLAEMRRQIDSLRQSLSDLGA